MFLACLELILELLAGKIVLFSLFNQPRMYVKDFLGMSLHILFKFCLHNFSTKHFTFCLLDFYLLAIILFLKLLYYLIVIL
jgi:hypothetical protein